MEHVEIKSELAKLKEVEPAVHNAAEYAAARSRLRAQGVEPLRLMLQELGVVYRSGRLTPTHNVFSKLNSRLDIDPRCVAVNDQLRGGPFVAAHNLAANDEHWNSSEEQWIGRAGMSRRHRFVLLDAPQWSYFNALTFGLDAGTTGVTLSDAITTLEAMRGAAYALAEHEGGWARESVGMVFHCFPHNSVQALHLHVFDTSATGPTYDAINYKNLPLDDVLSVLRAEVAASTIETPPSSPISLAVGAVHPQEPAAPTRVLAVALGGGSDVLGALALARALVSPPLGPVEVVAVSAADIAVQGASAVECEAVEASQSLRGPPGGDFHGDSSMLQYLLSLPPTLAPHTAYFLRQPKDAPGGDGFTRASLEATSASLLELARKHSCTHVVGLDFGGDVVLPPPPLSSPASVPSDTATSASADAHASQPYTLQRDSLNLHALAAAARTAGAETTLVAAAPGVDAAAVAPAYAERLDSPGGGSVPVMVMGADGGGRPLLESVDSPAPRCELDALPHELLESRLPAQLEAEFTGELRRLASRIFYDADEATRREHAYKTCARSLQWSHPNARPLSPLCPASSMVACCVAWRRAGMRCTPPRQALSRSRARRSQASSYWALPAPPSEAAPTCIRRLRRGSTTSPSGSCEGAGARAIR